MAKSTQQTGRAEPGSTAVVRNRFRPQKKDQRESAERGARGSPGSWLEASTIPPDNSRLREFVADLYAAMAMMRLLRHEIAASLSLTSAEYSVLLAVWYLERGEDITVRAIARHLHVAAPNVTSEVVRLVKKGLLTKTPDKLDRRAVEIGLTKRSRGVLVRTRADASNYQPAAVRWYVIPRFDGGAAISAKYYRQRSRRHKARRIFWICFRLNQQRRDASMRYAVKAMNCRLVRGRSDQIGLLTRFVTLAMEHRQRAAAAQRTARLRESISPYGCVACGTGPAGRLGHRFNLRRRDERCLKLARRVCKSGEGDGAVPSGGGCRGDQHGLGAT